MILKGVTREEIGEKDRLMGSVFKEFLLTYAFVPKRHCIFATLSFSNNQSDEQQLN